jgi:hypothetical protein
VTAASFGLAGNLVGGLSIGAVRTLGHLTFSGRWFHQGGIPDITLTFGEKLLTDYFVNDFLGTYTPLSSGHEAKTLAGIAGPAEPGRRAGLRSRPVTPRVPVAASPPSRTRDPRSARCR